MLTPAKKTALQQLLDKVKTLVQSLGLSDSTSTQALSMPDIYNQVGYTLDMLGQNDGVYRRLVDCYIDGDQIYAIFSMEGKLFRCTVTLQNGSAELGAPEQVEITHQPVGQALQVFQQADGKYRWFAFPAATAILNRNNWLNSRQLYDNFIKHIKDGDAPMPYLSLYHILELNLGQADFVERDGYALLISGTFNDTPLAQELAQRKDWKGVSIQYDCTEEALLEVDGAVELPVHLDGVLIEVSALQSEAEAGCPLTHYYSPKGVPQMNKAQKQKLLDLAGNNPQAVAQVEALDNIVAEVNQTIVGDNLVRQEGAQAPATEPATQTTEPVTEPVPAVPTGENPPAAQEINLTDEALQAIGSYIRQGLVTDIQAATETLRTAMDATVAELRQTLAGLETRLQGLEQTDQAKVAQAIADLPRTTINVGFRPSAQNQSVEPSVPATDDSQSVDTGVLVQPTLEKIKASQVKSK